MKNYGYSLGTGMDQANVTGPPQPCAPDTPCGPGHDLTATERNLFEPLLFALWKLGQGHRGHQRRNGATVGGLPPGARQEDKYEQIILVPPSVYRRSEHINAPNCGIYDDLTAMSDSYLR